ncbi:hypothetical protein EJB05_11360, partial [Eragrostis curvula]
MAPSQRRSTPHQRHAARPNPSGSPVRRDVLNGATDHRCMRPLIIQANCSIIIIRESAQGCPVQPKRPLLFLRDPASSRSVVDAP